MYLKKTKAKNGRIYLSICESYRQDGRTRTRTVEKCGYLDELQETMDDPIAFYAERAKSLTRRAEQSAKTSIPVSTQEQIGKDGLQGIWLGALPVSRIYHLLEIDRFWRIRSAGSKMPADLNAVFRMLVYLRIYHPSSMLKAWEARRILPDRCNFTPVQLCRSIEHLARFEAAYRSWINTRAAAYLAPRKDTLYCGISNYYFEVQEAEASKMRGRGRKGKKKPNPIVQEGLLLQGNNMPLDYEVFIGEVDNTLTLLPVIEKMKGRHHQKRFVIVMDRGLAVTENLKNIVDAGDGFIFNQSVNQLSEQDREWVLSDEGYRTIREGRLRMKSRLETRRIETVDEEGNLVARDMPIKQIACWDADLAVKAKEQRAHILEKNQVIHGHTRRKVVHSSKLDDNAQVHILYQTNWQINWKKVEAEERKDGYYCIYTSETQTDSREVRNAFVGLNQVENTFRVVRSAYDEYPFPMSREDIIRAHFMMCYTSLVIVRILQSLIGDTSTIEEIIDDLAQVKGYAEDANWYLFTYRTDLLDAIGEATGVDMTRRRLSRKQVKDMLAETKKPQTQAPARRGGRRRGENLYPFPEISPKEIPEDAR